MALRVKTVEYALDPRLTPLATNTTLATATRYDAPSLTLTLPETTSRTFRSVKIVASWRCAVTTTAATYTGWRIGIKLGAVAFDDLDQTPSAISGNTGDHELSFVTRDVTSYFVTNFGGAATQTCQIGFAMSQGTANFVNNVTLKLLITYEYNDTGLTSEVKTVRIPIQSDLNLLSTSHAEIGTTGTGAAPANQIPILTGTGGFLPEATVSIKRAWIEWWANDSSTTTTDFSFIYQVDSTTEVTHVLVEQGLNTGVLFYTQSIYDTTTHSTTSAHALKARSDLNATFNALGAVLHVTYTYDPSTTTTVCNSIMMSPGDIKSPSGHFTGTTSGDQEVVDINLWVEEPGTITLKQSGVLFFIQSPSGATVSIYGGSQTARPYVLWPVVGAGGYGLVHRCDHSSGWTLARGYNQNPIKFYTSANLSSVMGSLAIINYHSGVAATGINTHNKTTFWSVSDIGSQANSSTREIATSEQTTPNIPETKYFLNSVTYDCMERHTNSVISTSLQAEVLSGEYDADGWLRIGSNYTQNDFDMNVCRYIYPATNLFNKSSYMTGKLNIETSRKYKILSVSTIEHWVNGIYLTYHSVTFTLTGTATGYTGDGSGITIRAYRSDNNEYLGSGTTVAGGGFTIDLFDDTIQVFVEAQQDSTHYGRSKNVIAG